MIEKISINIDRFNEIIGRVFAWLALLMVITMFANVILRYLVNTNLVWQQEAITFMHAVLFLTCAGYTLLKEEHVRVDIFYQRFSDRTKAIVNLIGTIIFIFPVCLAISFYSYDYIIDSWRIFESSPEYKGIYGIFLLKTFIWFFCFSVFLQGISIIIKSIIKIKE